MSLVKLMVFLCIPSDLLGVEEGEEVSVIIID